jgi:hypothetical protein
MLLVEELMVFLVRLEAAAREEDLELQLLLKSRPSLLDKHTS